MTTLKASEERLVKIQQARRERGWTIEDPRWLVEASQKLEPDRTWAEVGPYANGVSLPTWRRFLAGRVSRKCIRTNKSQCFQGFLHGFAVELGRNCRSSSLPHHQWDGLTRIWYNSFAFLHKKAPFFREQLALFSKQKSYCVFGNHL